MKAAQKLTSKGESLTKLRPRLDMAARFESKKEAVCKFGGVVDWKAHRLQIVERQKLRDQELEKARDEIPDYKRWSDEAEEAKTAVLNELNSTRRLIEELKLNLEMAQMEEIQAKQDSELAMLRQAELEQGIAEDASAAAKAQLEVAKARHADAVSELKSMKAELETLRKEYDCLVGEKALTAVKVDIAEKTVEELTFELIAAKETLESSHTYHLEAEEKRIGAASAREHDLLTREKELKEANEEIERLDRQVISTKNSCTELKLNEELEEETREEMEVAIALAKKELEEERVKIEKAITKVRCLKIAAESLGSELQKEKSALPILKLREEMASLAVSALETEVEDTLLELALVQMKEREARLLKSELPKQLQLLATMADQTKSSARTVREEMQKAKKEAVQAQAAARTIETRLIAAQKEIEASKASKRLALAAIKALKESESESTTIEMDSPSSVTLSLEDYHELSKHAREAEELADIRVSASISQIKIAKESESKSWGELEEVNGEITAMKTALKIAKEKAEKAKEGELRMEQELKKWRAELEWMRKANEHDRKAIKSPKKNFTNKDSTKLDQGYQAYFPASHEVRPKLHFCAIISRKPSLSESKMEKTTMKSFFPRILVFLAGRKQPFCATVL